VLRLPPFRYAAPGTAGDAARLLADAQRIEGGEGVGPELDARADLAQLR